MRPARSSIDAIPQQVRRRAPINSVSTRIILCVFFSTMMTALIVSWLSIGAIHNDVGSRVEQRTRSLLEARRSEIELWRSLASSELAASAAVGTRWQGELLSNLAGLDLTKDESLDWASPDLDPPASPEAQPITKDLSPPPKSVAAYFDRLRLRPGPAKDLEPLGCFSVRIDLNQSATNVVGNLEGCLSGPTLVGMLHPSGEDVGAMRMLIVDAKGRIANVAGVRADTRLGSKLPLADLLAPHTPTLTDYYDRDGNRLVGVIAPLSETGWHLAIEMEHSRAFAAATAVTKQIFIVDVCIVLLFSVLAYKITLAIMQPIEALSQGALRITEGQVNYQIPIPANNDDELGLLTRTFNDMMEKLRNNQLEIERDRVRLGEKNEELQHANEILAQLSITDGLTKLHNHRYFQDHLTREIKRVSRTKQPLSLILLDIDDFKQLNDTHGHAAGDEVLVSLAAIMNDSARESDLIARYGGEEFVILMPNTDLAGAVHLAEKIRMAVESTRLIIGYSLKPIEITISLGVAPFDADRREFFAEADRALYRAKAAGKNCVIIASSKPSEAA
jgi:diguanylate cyclase (GGDEF)-like protein